MDKDCPVEKEDVSVWVTCKLKSEGWKEASKDGRVRGKAFQVEGTASAKMLRCSDSEVAQLCPALCDPVCCSPPGSSVHGILQAGVLEWVAIAFSRGSSQPRNRTQVSRIAGRRFTIWATREVLMVAEITIIVDRQINYCQGAEAERWGAEHKERGRIWGEGNRRKYFLLRLLSWYCMNLSNFMKLCA